MSGGRTGSLSGVTRLCRAYSLKIEKEAHLDHISGGETKSKGRLQKKGGGLGPMLDCPYPYFVFFEFFSKSFITL